MRRGPIPADLVLGGTGLRARSQPEQIEGLLSPDAEGVWALDPAVLDVPGVRAATVAFDRRGIERVMLTSRTRSGCDALRTWLTATQGEPDASGCAERRWNEDRYDVRYAEQPAYAMCTASYVVGEPLRTPLLVPTLEVDEAGGFGRIRLGADFADFDGLTPLERFQVVDEEAPEDQEDDEDRISSWQLPSPEVADDPWWSLRDELGGADLYGVELRFWRDRLEELTVRSTEEGCDQMRSTLVKRYGDGDPAGTPANRTWMGCDAVLDYRYAPVMLACRATIRSQEAEWRRAEARVLRREEGAAARRAELETLLSVGDDGWWVIAPGAVGWVTSDPDFAERGPRREPVFAAGEPQGFRLLDVRPDSLEHALGLRDGDHVVRLNKKPAEAFRPKKDLLNLRIAVRRGGEDALIEIHMPPGFHDAVLERRGVWP